MKRTPWITWRIYLLTFPVDILTLIFAADHARETFADFYLSGIVAFIAHLAIAPFVFLANKLSAKYNRWQLDITALIFLGAARGVFVIFAADLLNLTINTSIIHKVFNSAIALPLWFVTIAVIIESKKEFEKEFNILLKDFINAKDDNLSYSSNEVVFKLQRLASHFSIKLDEVKTAAFDPEEISNIAERIRELIEKDIKPVCNELWQKRRVKPPKMRFRYLATTALFEEKLPIPTVLFLSLPYLFIGIAGGFGAEIALFQCLLMSSYFLLIHFSIELIIKRAEVSQKTANHISLIAIISIPIIAQHFLVPSQYFVLQESWQLAIYMLFLSAAFIGLLLITNAVQLVGRHRARVLLVLRKLFEEPSLKAAVRQSQWIHQDKALANFLHGEVQAELTASSMLLNRAAKSGDIELAREALSRASMIFKGGLVTTPKLRLDSPEIRLMRIKESWSGIASIDVQLSKLDLIHPRVLRDAVNLIEECVANSIRHAGAQVIEIETTVITDSLCISVKYDGTPFTKGKKGLGMELFKELCTDWSIRFQDGHNYLKLILKNS